MVWRIQFRRITKKDFESSYCPFCKFFIFAMINSVLNTVPLPYDIIGNLIIIRCKVQQIHQILTNIPRKMKRPIHHLTILADGTKSFEMVLWLFPLFGMVHSHGKCLLSQLECSCPHLCKIGVYCDNFEVIIFVQKRLYLPVRVPDFLCVVKIKPAQWINIF